MCSGCGTLRFDPYLSAESLKNFYVDYYQVMYGRVPDRDAYLRRQASYGKRLLAVAGQFLRKGARVAEVGCGAGGALAVLHDAGYNVSGCDYSEPLLGIGRTLGLDDLRFGGVETLLEPPGSEKYDLVLLHHVFEHLADPVGFLQRLKPALSADGVVVIAVPDVTRIADFPFPSGNLRLFLHIAHKFNFTLRGIDAIARTVDMRVSEMRIELSTEAPELWVTFGSASRSPMNCKGPHGEPTSLLAYLHKVERRFIVGALREKAESVFRRASFGSC
jgi:2-polyprenyl-3-methyl-5-hydroxy-6-metoxy-1,4-benzoquinol methylase